MINSSVQKRAPLPLVSVIMPVYNTKEEYLREAIESILAQTYKKFELIIVDDCSEKSVEPIVRSYHDSRIQFHRLPKNKGASYARNVGYHLSTGQYIAVQDSDDISYPDRLAVQVKYMQKYPNIGVMGAQYHVLSSDSKEMLLNKFGSPEYLRAYTLFVCSPFGHSTVMMRRSVLAETMIRYDQSVICDDFKLFMDLMNKTDFMNIPRPLVSYRYHKNNTSNQKGEQLMSDVWNVRVKFWKKDLKLSDENVLLLKRFVTDEKLSLPELRKACNIYKSIVLYYAKKYNNPRMAEMAVQVLNNAYQKQNNSKCTFFSVQDGKIIDHTQLRVMDPIRKKKLHKENMRIG